MDGRLKFKRLFYIFEKVDEGFGANGTPQGHVKIEIKDGKGKLRVQLQNLKKPDQGAFYRLYLVKGQGEGVESVVPIGELEVERGKCDTSWDIDPLNVGRSHFDFEKFDAVALVLAGAVDNTVKCPLAAFKGKKYDVKSIIAGDMVKKASWQTTNIAGKSAGMTDAGKTDAGQFIDNTGDPESLCQKLNYYSNKEKDEEAVMGVSIKKAGDEGAKGSEALPAEDPYGRMRQFIASDNNNGRRSPQAGFTCPYMNFTPYTAINRGHKCPYTGFAAGGLQADMSRSSIENIKDLNGLFSSNFSFFEPFKTVRNDYRWWRIVEINKFDELMKSMDLNLRLSVNARIAEAKYKYGHVALGIYTDSKSDKKIIVLGVPGVYGVDERPFGSHGKWAQTEDKTSQYGTFGYWLLYYDPVSKKFLKT